MNDITTPLRLATGSHKAGSGKGCAMNVISWESGDSRITDMPACADPMLARVVQYVNDSYCTHRDDGGLLCPPCSLDVLALAHRTVGTVLVGWPEDATRRVYVRIALDEAESVARPGEEDSRVTRCREVVALWLDGKATGDDVWQARAYAVADAVAVAAAYAAAYAADAAYAVAYAAAYAADAAAAAYAADAAYAVAVVPRLGRAHRLIDRFQALTGTTAAPVPDETVHAAYAAMTAATA